MPQPSKEKARTMKPATNHDINERVDATAVEEAASVQHKVLLHILGTRNLVFSFLGQTPRDLSTLDATCKTFRKATGPLWEKLTMESHYEMGVTSHVVDPTYDFRSVTTRKFSWTARNVFLQLWQRKFEKFDLSLVDFEGIEETANSKDLLWCPAKRMGLTRVVLNNRSDDDKSTYMAVPDTLDATRFFIGQLVTDEERTLVPAKLLGGVCYFDSKGQLEGPISAFSHLVFESDCSDVASPSPHNVILCGEILMLARCFTSMKGSSIVSLGGFFLKDDDLADVFGWTVIKNENNYSEVERWRHKIVLDRWLCLENGRMYPRKHDFMFCIDLKSFRVVLHENQKDKITVYDRVVLPTDTDPTAALESIQGRLPAYKYVTKSDGYPVTCIKCENPTTNATWRLEGGRDTIWLGRSICLDCRIRYSDSAETWKCIHYREDETKLHCDEVVCAENDYVCSCSDAHDDPDLFCETQKTKPRRNRSIQLQIELSLERTKKAANGGEEQLTF